MLWLLLLRRGVLPVVSWVELVESVQWTVGTRPSTARNRRPPLFESRLEDEG